MANLKIDQVLLKDKSHATANTFTSYTKIL